jgi:2-polyprenyl-6-methoxyphenol hydroxylase-like FAD-dependent oxidoreductase
LPDFPLVQAKAAVSKIVLTVGGGIAGPGLAIALRRVGIDSVVYAAAPQPRDHAGACLHLGPSGLKALRQLGVEDRVVAVGFLNEQMGGVTVPRGALSRVLREAASEQGARFEFDKELVSVVERDGGVGARFADGTRVTGRLLIGADGIHSAARRSLFPDSPPPTYTGTMNVGGVANTTLEPTGNSMRMITGRNSLFAYAVRSGGETHWCSTFDQPDQHERDPRPRLLALHDHHAIVAEVLQAQHGDIGAYPVYDLPSLPRWSRGPACLIGDAAHGIGPHVEHGASHALEDAVLLAGCLKDETDPAAAFAAFEGRRRQQLFAA